MSFSSYEAKDAQELALIHEEYRQMVKRGDACTVALTNGRWPLRDEFFSQLVFERKILRRIIQTLEEIPGGIKPQLVTSTTDTYYSFFSMPQSLLSFIPPSWYYHTSTNPCLRLCFGLWREPCSSISVLSITPCTYF